MPVLRNIGLLARCCAEGGQSDLHALPGAALAWNDARIEWLGLETELPDVFEAEEFYDADGCLVVPGLIDCHTHLVFAGWRSDEFEMRVRGRSYREIARSGGGIQRTVRETRAADADQLIARAERNLRHMNRLGTTTVECKSGYGLDRATELKILQVYRQLNERQPTRIISTFLGAHVVPWEYRERRSEYVEFLCEEMIPEVSDRGLARFCDVFLEEGAFSLEEARQILFAGCRCGLKPKLHADQFSWQGGAELAAEVEAISADHLEQASPQGIQAMARAGVTAVALPLASLYLRQPAMPARQFIEQGVPVAIATDFNPGSAPSYHFPLAMMLGCVQLGMSPAEVLKAATIFAARAIGLEREVGSLEVGKYADLVLIDAPDVNHWLYHFRANACRSVFIGGKPLPWKE